MKKIVIFLLLLILFTSPCLAKQVENQDIPLGDNQYQLFVLAMTQNNDSPLSCYNIRDFDYNKDEDRLYFLFNKEINYTDKEALTPHWFQGVTDLNGNIDNAPDYPELFQFQRRNIEFDGDLTISFEGLYTNFENPSIVDLETSYASPYDRHKEVEGAVYFKGIRAFENKVAYYMNGGSPYFQIGTIAPFQTGYYEMGRIYDSRFTEAGNELAYDFRPSSDEFIYGGSIYTDGEWDQELRIVRLSLPSAMNYEADKDEGVIHEFTLQLPEQPSNYGTDYLRLSNLYATEDYIVVLYHVEELDRAFIQRYTYTGELIDGVEVNYYTRHITEGPNGNTLYVQQHGSGSEKYLEVMKVDWDGGKQTTTSNTSGPRPLIRERSHNGNTLAIFKAQGFGLIKDEDLISGQLSYRAPLRSKDHDVRLRIPYHDVQAKLVEGANALKIEFHGQTIEVSMKDLDCSQILSTLPCQNEPTLEIHCRIVDDGSVKTNIQLLVYEKTTPNTTVVHRTTLQ